MNTYIKKHIKYALVIALLAIVTTGCIRDNFEFDKLSMHLENEGEWEFPKLVNTTFTIGDLLERVDSTGLISTEDDGLIILVYSDTVYSAVGEEIIEFPDQQYDTIFNNQDFDNEGGFTDNSVTMIKNEVDYVFATFGNQLLDSVLLNSANVKISVNSDFEYEGVLTITFPEIKKNGQPYQKMINIDDNSGNYNEIITDEIESGYKIDFSNAEQINTIFITYELTLQGNDGQTVNADDICDIVVEFTDIKYDYIWGYVGQQIINIPAEEMAIDFFSGFDNGEFELPYPRVKLKINNSFGLPVGVFMETIQFRVGDDNTWVDLTGEGIPTASTPWMINTPEESFPDPITYATTNVKITGRNTTLNTIISQLPDRLRYSEKVVLNPNGNEDDLNFMANDSKVEALIDFELPLWGRTSGINYTDTLEMDLSNIANDSEQIDHMDLTLTIGNGLPHQIGMKVYLLDSLYNVVDTIPNANDDVIMGDDIWWFVESGIIGADSVINQETGKTISNHTIRYESNSVDILDNVKYIKLKAKYITTDGTGTNAPYVKYFDFYEMDFDVALKVKLNINENL
ncbi:MAG: hypothetical protein PF489_08610 [Salinivirgaceae bacterium]|jgi:hypothetical protein|nr:hypothetical protein [Salinivirgaceae bacterium]